MTSYFWSGQSFDLDLVTNFYQNLVTFAIFSHFYWLNIQLLPDSSKLDDQILVTSLTDLTRPIMLWLVKNRKWPMSGHILLLVSLICCNFTKGQGTTEAIILEIFLTHSHFHQKNIGFEGNTLSQLLWNTLYKNDNNWPFRANKINMTSSMTQ